MTKLLWPVDAPVLPHDVLRLVFEQATKSDRRKAAKYTLVSKLVRLWVEKCLYSDVQLYSEKSVRKFLRTLESSTKSKLFFSTQVKSLSIAYDTHDFEWAARVLSFCGGVESLTIWAIPSHRTLDTPVNSSFHTPNHSIPGMYRLPQSVLPGPRLHDHYNSLLDALNNHLRPKHLAVLIDEPLYIPKMPHPTQIGMASVMSPDFSLGLFSNLTHLSIANRWTEWSAWAWSWSATPFSQDAEEPSYILEFLPRLTHLSLEIQVGKRRVYSGAISPPPPPPPTTTTTTFNSRRNQKLAEHVGLSLSTILTSPELSSHLLVLLCVLSFDEQPHCTARMIKEQTDQHLTMLLQAAHRPHSIRIPRFGPDSPRSGIGDPRLVFAYDGDPFSEREAGSMKVYDMWKNAEEVVRLQWRDQVKAVYDQDQIIFEL